jgi:hypothetical protein
MTNTKLTHYAIRKALSSACRSDTGNVATLQVDFATSVLRSQLVISDQERWAGPIKDSLTMQLAAQIVTQLPLLG